MNETNAGYARACQAFEAANSKLNAFISVCHFAENRQDQTGKDLASHCSCGDDRVTTMAVKDNIGVEGFPLAAGLGGPVLQRDETISGEWVKWLVRHGFVIKGKTNMYELGYGAPGCGLPPAVNPWNHSLIPGGSSSGSAAAVAAALSNAALGTDAAGSVRIPAEYCGVLSYKPSGKQTWHKDGIWPGRSTLDVIGVMARDMRLLSQAVPFFVNRDEGDRGNIAHARSNSGRKTLRIGILDLKGEDVDDDQGLLQDEVRSWAENSGFSTQTVRLPGLGNRVRDVIWKIFAYEYSRALEAHLTEEARAVLSAPSRRLLADGPQTSPEDYSEALSARHRLQQQYADELGGCDAVVTPVTPVRPYSLAWSRAFAQCEEDDASAGSIQLSNVEALLTRKTRYTAPFNLVEYPTLTLPMRLHQDGLPVGVQVVSVPENELEMWSVARRIWQELWHGGVNLHRRVKFYGSFADAEGRHQDS